MVNTTCDIASSVDTIIKDLIKSALAYFIRFVKFFAVTVIYLSLGTFIFFYIEHCYEIIQTEPNELEKRFQSVCSKLEYVNETYSGSNRTHIKEALSLCSLEDIKEETIKCELNYYTAVKWLKYSSSVVLTVGYGNIVVKSDLGKIITMVYAFPGFSLVIASYANIANALCCLLKATILTMEIKILKRKSVEFCEVKILISNLLLTVAAIMIEGLVHTLKETENLTYLNGVYLAFCSVTTIGFGDFEFKMEEYLKRPLLMIFTILVYWGGLGLVAACLSSLSTVFNKQDLDVTSKTKVDVNDDDII